MEACFEAEKLFQHVSQTGQPQMESKCKQDPNLRFSFYPSAFKAIIYIVPCQVVSDYVRRIKGLFLIHWNSSHGPSISNINNCNELNSHTSFLQDSQNVLPNVNYQITD